MNSSDLGGPKIFKRGGERVVHVSLEEWQGAYSCFRSSGDQTLGGISGDAADKGRRWSSILVCEHGKG